MRDSNAERPRSMHRALVDLLGWLDSQGYAFTTVTPETPRLRVWPHGPTPSPMTCATFSAGACRSSPSACPPPFAPRWIESACWKNAGQHLKEPRARRPRPRPAADPALGLSDRTPATPSSLGPDRLSIRRPLSAPEDWAKNQTGRLDRYDIGAGSGVGAIIAAGPWTRPDRIVPHRHPTPPPSVLRSKANAAFAGIEVDCILTSDARQVLGAFDLILANPPFIDDALAAHLPPRRRPARRPCGAGLDGPGPGQARPRRPLPALHRQRHRRRPRSFRAARPP